MPSLKLKKKKKKEIKEKEVVNNFFFPFQIPKPLVKDHVNKKYQNLPSLIQAFEKSLIFKHNNVPESHIVINKALCRAFC